MIQYFEDGQIKSEEYFLNGEYFESDDNTIMVHISRIREKIENDPKKPEHLITVRGVGYKFEE